MPKMVYNATSHTPPKFLSHLSYDVYPSHLRVQLHVRHENGVLEGRIAGAGHLDREE